RQLQLQLIGIVVRTGQYKINLGDLNGIGASGEEGIVLASHIQSQFLVCSFLVGVQETMPRSGELVFQIQQLDAAGGQYVVDRILGGRSQICATAAGCVLNMQDHIGNGAE